MTWFSPATTRDGILATLPHYQQGFDALYQALWQLQELPAQALELCRLRVAQLHRSDAEWARKEVPVDEARRAALTHWHQSPLFGEGEKACLALAEVYTMDPQAITDSQADAVKAAYGEAGLVALVEALGLFYGLTRLSLLWELPPEETEESA